MVELLAGATASAIAGSATAAGATAAMAASTATTAATSLSTILSILQGGATVVGILGTLGAANAQANAFEADAMQTQLQGGQEHLASTNRQTQMKRELMRVLGENDVSVAAAGIDITGGIAESERANAQASAARELSIERDDDDMRRALIRARAQGLRSRARDSRTGGLFQAIGQGVGFGVDLAERG